MSLIESFCVRQRLLRRREKQHKRPAFSTIIDKLIGLFDPTFALDLEGLSTKRFAIVIHMVNKFQKKAYFAYCTSMYIRNVILLR